MGSLLVVGLSHWLKVVWGSIIQGEEGVQQLDLTWLIASSRRGMKAAKNSAS